VSLAGDLLEGTLLYDAQGNAYVQPLLRPGETLRVPPGQCDAIHDASIRLKVVSWAAAVVSGMWLEPRAGAAAAILVMAVLLAGHPAGMWWLSRRLQRADARRLGTPAQRLRRLAQDRGERRILGKLTWAAFLLTVALALFGVGIGSLAMVAALFGAATAIQNVVLLRHLRAHARAKTRVPSGGNAGHGHGAARRRRKPQGTRRRPRASR
jgi:hypothetical protein